MILPLVGPLSLVFGFGLGVANRFQTEYSQIKQIDVGIEKRLSLIDLKTSYGNWWDATHHPGALDSWYLSEQITVGPHFKNFDVGATFGVAYIAKPDTVLGSHFQFCPGAEWTIKDSRNVQTGVYFEHFSDAGLNKINEGRNFLGVRIKL